MFPSERLPVAQRYAELLATEGVVRGLIGPREVPRLWDRHLVNCALVAQVVSPGASVCDVGSGAGLPGLVLAIARPDLTVTLVEPLLRRTTFLEEVVSALGLERVDVVRGRADSLHGHRRFAVVTSRAVAPLDRLLRWSMPLVEPEGALVAMKGSSVTEEVEAARPVLDELGCAEPEVVVLTGPSDEPASGGGTPPAAPSTATVLRVAWAEPGRVTWPIAAPSSGGRTEQRAGRGRTKAHRRRRA
ncbi:MAG: 16S rRNA (guanine(527)-N(7))-methyltransferase RsmG [Nocardioidaceae bacterium]|nr:16S rRNA (guanine(527)-N(7))-methyltransferase RsmG [Nocardioidaceae bacterium]